MTAFQTSKNVGKLSFATSQDHPSHFQLHTITSLCPDLQRPQSPGFYSYLFKESKASSFMLDEFQDCPKFSHVCCSDTPTSPSVNI